jgi:hypothetical protein
MSTEGIERRRSERFLFKASATVRRGEEGEALRARVVNASLGGLLLAVKASEPLTVGDRVICEVNVPEGFETGMPRRGVGRVVRVDGEYAGVEFDIAG